jgi:hypothetical protein
LFHLRQRRVSLRPKPIFEAVFGSPVAGLVSAATRWPLPIDGNDVAP